MMLSNRTHCLRSILTTKLLHAKARHIKRHAADVFDLPYENNKIGGLGILNSDGVEERIGAFPLQITIIIMFTSFC